MHTNVARHHDEQIGSAPDTWTEARARLVAFVARRVDSPEAAEDITQTVLERLARSGPEAITNPNAWLHRAARNAIIDHYRTRRADLPLGDEPELAGEPGVEAEIDRSLDDPQRELARCLRPLLGDLPDHYRRALTLVDLDGMTHEAAARAEHLSVSGMKSRVQRGRAKLAALLTRCCEVTLNADRSVEDYRPGPSCDCSAS